MQGSGLPEAQTRHADPREVTGRVIRRGDAGRIMATDHMTASGQMADTNEIRIPVTVQELISTLREHTLFTRRVRLCCTTVDVRHSPWT